MDDPKQIHMARLAEAETKLDAIRALIESRRAAANPHWGHVGKDRHLIELLDRILAECKSLG